MKRSNIEIYAPLGTDGGVSTPIHAPFGQGGNSPPSGYDWLMVDGDYVNVDGDLVAVRMED